MLCNKRYNYSILSSKDSGHETSNQTDLCWYWISIENCWQHFRLSSITSFNNLSCTLGHNPQERYGSSSCSSTNLLTLCQIIHVALHSMKFLTQTSHTLVSTFSIRFPSYLIFCFKCFSVVFEVANYEIVSEICTHIKQYSTLQMETVFSYTQLNCAKILLFSTLLEISKM